MNISVCTDSVFKGLPCEEAIPLAAAAGAKTIEFWNWWDKDLDKVENALNENGVSLQAFCTRFISLVDPSLRVDYLKGLRETAAAASRLGAQVIISQVGNELPSDRAAQHASLVDGLREAAKIVEDAGLTLCFEPLDTRVNHPGYYLVSSDEAFEIVDEVSSPRVRVLFDIYHQQISEGDILSHVLPNIEKIGHFHSAGSFGRHELWNGELNYSYICRKIHETGTRSCFGLEFFPEGDPQEAIRRTLDELKL